MISWRNPEAQHASLGRRHLRQADPRRARRGGGDLRESIRPCSPGSARVASSPRSSWVTSPLSGRTTGSPASASPSRRSTRPGRARRRAARRRHGGRRSRGLQGTRLLGRQGAGRGVRLAAPVGPDLELLGEQLPARQEAAGLRHPLLERRHDPDDGRAAPRLRRMATSNAISNGTARMLGTDVNLGKVMTDTYIVAGVADHICPWQGVTARRRCSAATVPVRAEHQRPYRSAGEPALKPEGELPRRRRDSGQGRRLAGGRCQARRLMVGGLRRLAGANDPVPSSPRLPKWVRPPIPRPTPLPAATSTRGECEDAPADLAGQ